MRTVLQSRKPSKFRWRRINISRRKKTMPSIRYRGIKYVRGYKDKTRILYINLSGVASNGIVL